MKRVWSGIWTMTLYYIFGKWYIEKESRMRGAKMRLPQEIFAEELWAEWFFNYGNVCKKTLPDKLRRCNLKLRKGKTLDDVKLIIGRALKDTPCIASKQIERIAEEADKVCIIANWEDAVAKYKG